MHLVPKEIAKESPIFCWFTSDTNLKVVPFVVISFVNIKEKNHKWTVFLGIINRLLESKQYIPRISNSHSQVFYIWVTEKSRCIALIFRFPFDVAAVSDSEWELEKMLLLEQQDECVENLKYFFSNNPVVWFVQKWLEHRCMGRPLNVLVLFRRQLSQRQIVCSSLKFIKRNLIRKGYPNVWPFIQIV